MIGIQMTNTLTHTLSHTYTLNSSCQLDGSKDFTEICNARDQRIHITIQFTVFLRQMAGNQILNTDHIPKSSMRKLYRTAKAINKFVVFLKISDKSQLCVSACAYKVSVLERLVEWNYVLTTIFTEIKHQTNFRAIK